MEVGCGPRGKRLGFPRACRLAKRREYLTVHRHGKRFGGKYLVLYSLALDNAEAPSRCGITVSKRVSLRAVRRNKVRRMIREALRLHEPTQRTGHWLVVIARRGSISAKQTRIEQDLRALLIRAGIWSEAT